jgi:hypothetical protein
LLAIGLASWLGAGGAWAGALVEFPNVSERGPATLVGCLEAHTVPRVASTMIPPFAPLPFPFGYFPGGPPTYGYAPVYPPPLASEPGVAPLKE